MEKKQFGVLENRKKQLGETERKKETSNPSRPPVQSWPIFKLVKTTIEQRKM